MSSLNSWVPKIVKTKKRKINQESEKVLHSPRLIFLLLSGTGKARLTGSTLQGMSSAGIEGHVLHPVLL